MINAEPDPPCVHRKSRLQHRNADGEVPHFRAGQDPLHHSGCSVWGPVLRHRFDRSGRFSRSGRAIKAIQLAVVVCDQDVVRKTIRQKLSTREKICGPGEKTYVEASHYYHSRHAAAKEAQ